MGLSLNEPSQKDERQQNGGRALLDDFGGGLADRSVHGEEEAPWQTDYERTDPEPNPPRGHPSQHLKGPFRIMRDIKERVINFQAQKYLTFYRLHFMYILVIVNIGSMIIWLSPKRRRDGKNIAYIDALFNAASAGCVVGLNTIDTEQFSVTDQVVLMFLIIMGGHVFTSLLPVLVRRYYFYLYIKKYTKQGPSEGELQYFDSSKGKLTAIKEDTPFKSDARSGLGLSLPCSPSNGSREGNQYSFHNDNLNEIYSDSTPGILSGDFSHIESNSSLAPDFNETKENLEGPLAVDYSIPHSHTWAGESANLAGQRLKLAIAVMRMNEHLSQRGAGNANSIGIGQMRRDDQTSEFGASAEEQRPIDSSELRTKEYRALHALSWLVPSYIFVIHFIGFIVIYINFAAAPSEQAILDRQNVSRTFFSAFQAVSAFQNAGLVLLSNSLADLKKATCLLAVVGVLILLGNTMYAPTMRGIIYIFSRISAPKHKEPFQYLLDHPRRCYTHLFPRDTTLWLIITVIAFNASELVAMCSLDWNRPPLKDFHSGYKVFIGLFQSLNTRSAGFLVLDLTGISPAMKVLYIVMMYVAVYPVYLSRQTSRESPDVYDDLDVGIFEVVDETHSTGLLSQGRMLLARDSALIFIATFVICIIQSEEIENDATNFTIFNIFFEVISAYGNVGLSMGYKCSPQPICVPVTYSFVGAWKPLAKFVIIVLMMFGRHRGLPDDIDQAVTIPQRKTFKKGPKRQLQDLDDLEFAKLAEANFKLRSFKKSPSTKLLSPRGLLPRMFSGSGGSPAFPASALPKAASTGGSVSPKAALTKSASLPNSSRRQTRPQSP